MIKLATILLPVFVFAVAVAPALANPTTFAGYTQTNNTPDFALTSTSLGGNNYMVTINSGGQVNFAYSIGGTPFGTSVQLATLNLTATSTFSGNCAVSDAACTTSGSSYTETGYSGSFSITATTPFMGLTNLLSGTFSVGQLSSSIGASSGMMESTASSTNPNQVVFTSDFLNFANTVGRDATFSLASLTPIFSVLGNTGLHNGFPAGFNAIGSAFFSDMEAPEPSMFPLLASGLLGLCLWQRKRRSLQR
jgi:hypothetical protein